MTYKQTDVFLSAEDCAKIAPYIPADLLKEWEWWWVGNAPTTIWLQHLPAGHYANYGETKIPALDVGILGRRICDIFKPITPIDFPRYFPTHDTTGNRSGIGWRWDHALSELQNRRDAIMYLIDNGLIEKEDANA